MALYWRAIISKPRNNKQGDQWPKASHTKHPNRDCDDCNKGRFRMTQY